MLFIVVDDEPPALHYLTRVIKELEPECELMGFSSPLAALEYARAGSIDAAFLDIEMPELDGLKLAKRLKELKPDMNIVFVTSFSEYAVEAFSLYASGYLLKPASAEDVRQALDNLRRPLKKAPASKPKIQTFGNFEVFVSGVRLHFFRSKSKEILAYLVHKRGTSCSLKELAGVIFEDKEYTHSIQKQMQTYIASMMKVLQDAHIEDIIVKKHNSLSVCAEKVDCDYYRFIDKDPSAISLYTGEYMSNYSWAEFTVGYLDSRITAAEAEPHTGADANG